MWTPDSGHERALTHSDQWRLQGHGHAGPGGWVAESENWVMAAAALSTHRDQRCTLGPPTRLTTFTCLGNQALGLAWGSGCAPLTTTCPNCSTTPAPKPLANTQLTPRGDRSAPYPKRSILPSQSHIRVGATGLELAATLTQTRLPLGAMLYPIPPSGRVGAYLGLSSRSSTCRPNSDLPTAHPAAQRDTATLLR